MNIIRIAFFIYEPNMDNLLWRINLGISHMFVLFVIYFTSKIRARVEPGRLAVPVAFRIGGFDLSFVETFDGRDRHVLSSLLVFLRSFFHIYKSVNWVSTS